LQRILEDGVTVGLLTLPSQNKLFTIELPWRGNSENVSCIPSGEYICRKRMYNEKGYMTFEVTGVDGRTYILFHIGNFERNTEGCILINDMIGADHDQLRGVTSGQAFREFWTEMKVYDEFKLKITEVPKS